MGDNTGKHRTNNSPKAVQANVQWDIRGKAVGEDFIAGWVGFGSIKKRKGFSRQREQWAQRREQVTCLDNSKFSLAGTYERGPAGTKLEKYIRARLSLLNVKSYSGDN